MQIFWHNTCASVKAINSVFVIKKILFTEYYLQNFRYNVITFWFERDPQILPCSSSIAVRIACFSTMLSSLLITEIMASGPTFIANKSLFTWSIIINQNRNQWICNVFETDNKCSLVKATWIITCFYYFYSFLANYVNLTSC